jgi:hypothetical protein
MRELTNTAVLAQSAAAAPNLLVALGLTPCPNIVHRSVKSKAILKDAASCAFGFVSDRRGTRLISRFAL